MAIVAEFITEIIKVAVFFGMAIGCVVLGKVVRNRKDKKDLLKTESQTEE